MITSQQIARYISGTLVGDTALEITGIGDIINAKSGDLSFVDNKKYVTYLKTTQAALVIIGKNCPVPDEKTVVIVENPSLSFSKALELFIKPEKVFCPGIHETAVIHPRCNVGKNVSIGPYTVIEEKVNIEDGVCIGSGVYLGVGAAVGKNTKLYPGVIVYGRSVIGAEVIIQSGTVIGSDGFGYITVNGIHKKLPQLGNVIIEDAVEIGANVTIDRARFGSTIIEKGVIIDNLVHIAHNVRVGKNSIVVAQVGISGSTSIGQGAILAGQVGIAGHLTIGERAIILAQSGISKNVPPGEKWFGSPARNVIETNRQIVSLKKVPELIKKIKNLEQKVHTVIQKQTTEK
ncbi:UDP-3-O-(3-hydroxymyristoyl)glucosamine N-acyltransferase [Chlamydiota bacterium]